MSIEQNTADTILENPIVVQVENKQYEVPPVTLATLIEVSKYISTLPQLALSREDFTIHLGLKYAKESEYLSDIISLLILGKRRTRVSVFGITLFNRQKRLSRRLSQRCTPKQIFDMMYSIVNTMEIGFFLETIIFLNEVNITKQTKMTASGD